LDNISYSRRGDLGRPALEFGTNGMGRCRASKLAPTRRKDSLRLKNWDYFLPGPYFFTICTNNRKNIFDTEGIRKNVIKVFKNIAEEFEVSLHAIVIATDHIHGLITLSENKKMNLWQYIGKAKVEITQMIIGRASPPLRGLEQDKIWQRSFYDHVIRNDKDFLEKAKYIQNHPVKEEGNVSVEWH